MATFTYGDYTINTDGLATAVATDKTKTSYSAIPSSVTYGGQTYTVRSLYGCFRDCVNMTTSPSIPSTILDMNDAFYNCSSLKTPPTIPSSVTTMTTCFGGCTSMTTTPTIPNSVQYMSACFIDCVSLTRTPNIPSGAINISGYTAGCTGLSTPLSIPNGITDVGAIYAEWTHLSSTPTFPNSVTSLSNTFRDCTGLTTPPTIPSGVTDLRYCFKGCVNLTTPPTIPSGVTDMYACLQGCTGLSSFPTIPNRVTDLSWCFAYCTNMVTPPSIPESVTIMEYCFLGCTNLATAPTLPSNVTNLRMCFDSCISLSTPPTIPNKVTTLNSCFRGCTGLSTAPSIPNSVTDMAYAFKGCTSLTTPPVIPSGVMKIEGIFRECTNLTSAPDVPSAVTTMSYAFKDCPNLAGNIVVNGTPTTITEMFVGTANPIYIVNGGSASASNWKSIASEYLNVHYEADDNPSPTINSFNAMRVASSGSTTPSPTGTWAYIQALITVYDTYIPVGWASELKSRALTDNGTAVSPSWQPSPITSYPVTTYCWIDIDDLARHNISLTIADTIVDGSTEMASKTSATLTVTIPKAYALVDYYHDDNTGTEGMAIGKLAEDADLLDIAMPTKFRDAITVTDASSVFRALFDYMHPVGSYYETSDTTFNPNTTWGGTWVLETEGLVHISAGTNYPVSGASTDTKDGGNTTSATGDHTLTTTEIPAHTHGQRSLTGNWYCVNLNSVTADGIMTKYAYSSSNYTGFSSNSRAGSRVAINATHTHDSVGGGGSHNHGNVSTMQPYIIVNRWHRTA